MSSLLLVGATFASMALGVLVAYAICHAMFRMFSAHAQTSASRRAKQPAVSFKS